MLTFLVHLLTSYHENKTQQQPVTIANNVSDLTRSQLLRRDLTIEWERESNAKEINRNNIIEFQKHETRNQSNEHTIDAVCVTCAQLVDLY